MTNTFTVKTWDEKVVSGDQDAPRFAHAHLTADYTGDTSYLPSTASTTHSPAPLT